MSTIDSIIRSGSFGEKFERELCSLVSQQSVPASYFGVGSLDGTVAFLQGTQLEIKNIKNHGDYYSGEFISDSIAVYNITHPDSSQEEGEIELRCSGSVNIEVEKERLAVIDSDYERLAFDCFLSVAIDQIRFAETEKQELFSGQAASSSRREASQRLKIQEKKFGEPVDLELIPEGELQTQEFAGKSIRKILHAHEWFFCIADIVGALTESTRPSGYWADLKLKILRLGGFDDLEQKIAKLRMPDKNGSFRLTETANTETIFRIIQSIPSAKAAPFKQWLARVGFERIQERQNPSIAIKRAVVDYQLQGRSMEWIETRLRTILSRRELTDEWQKRGIKEGLEFAQLTDMISKQTFDKTPKEHREIKGLTKNQSLRDNMSSIELILTMLGETSTKQIAQAKNASGFQQNKSAARAGGSIAGNARKQLEKELGQPVVSSENNLRRLEPSKELLEFPESLKNTITKIAEMPELSKPKNRRTQ